jgi:hypothetical protein
MSSYMTLSDLSSMGAPGPRWRGRHRHHHGGPIFAPYPAYDYIPPSPYLVILNDEDDDDEDDKKKKKKRKLMSKLSTGWTWP